MHYGLKSKLTSTTQFDSELNSLSSRVRELGGLVESQIRLAMQSVGEFNADVARQVIETEVRVNQMEVEIDRDLVKRLREKYAVLWFFVALGAFFFLLRRDGRVA